MQILIYLAVLAGIVAGSYFGVEALKDAGRQDERAAQEQAASQAKDEARAHRDAVVVQLEAIAKTNEDAAVAANLELERLRNDREKDVGNGSVVFDGAWDAWLRVGKAGRPAGN